MTPLDIEIITIGLLSDIRALEGANLSEEMRSWLEEGRAKIDKLLERR